ncbi:MAG: SDR family NAD(P)-dependent oxidoreductase [Flavobacteriaceae bacterium]|nr:SDR family NAD(P)-dependent oxidoreductase [Bacteroidia bacterium]MBT8286440.1 SDR family NAD(P)-dependent oxidoreductase [Bacteroidia bacterium]NNF75716.1 SDR family NAD(P)-dependent oxidoreductase [Flavobacteriaceae bacterium]NNK74263.1 SDR family NAD(P)-dependent oxidoreductase [Flavobacteriaceae bacterium]
MPTAIVFGATSGIGKQLAEFLIADGYNVIITGRRSDNLSQLKHKYPASVRSDKLNVQDVKRTAQLFEQWIQEFSQIDLILHCAGIGYENPELDWTKEQDTIKTNVEAAAHIYDLAFNLFKAQGFGHLVSISSIASLRGNRHSPAYFASKAFQVNYLESLYFKSKEIKGGRIYITDVRPGYVDTRMALGNDKFWMSKLNKASKQIYSAIKRKKRKVYITKRWLLIAWVLKIVPSWLIKKVM